MKTTFKSLLTFLMLTLPPALVLLCASANWHVSTGRSEAFLHDMHVTCLVEGLTDGACDARPRVRRLPQLDAGDALYNGFSFFVATTCAIPLFLGLSAGILLVGGLPLLAFFRSAGAAALLGVLLLGLFGCMTIYIVGTWGLLFFEPCTSGYLITWFLTGILAMAGGLKLNLHIFKGVERHFRACGSENLFHWNFTKSFQINRR
jgi:hypothetical protein